MPASITCGLGVEVSIRVRKILGSNPSREMDVGQNFKNLPVKYFLKKMFLSTLRGILLGHEKFFWVHATSTSYVVKKEEFDKLRIWIDG